MQRHIGQFESLRGIAAIWVFVSHALLIAEWRVPLLDNGDLAVDLFILLSGFVITLLVLRRPEPYGGYIFRRAVRLYPLYLIALLLGWATQHLYAPVVGAALFGGAPNPAFLDRAAVVEVALPQHLALHLTMLHGAVHDSVLPAAALAFSGPLWSISLEWQFYLVAPWLIWCLDVRRPGRWRWALFALAGIAGGNAVVRLMWDFEVPAFLPLRLPLFVAGIICGIGWQRAREVPPMQLVAVLVGGAVALFAIGNAALPLVIWGVAYWAAARTGAGGVAGRINALLGHPSLRWLGARSYGLYVLHMPIVLALSAWVIVPYAAMLGQSGVLLAVLACFPVVIALAALLYRWIERPLMDWAGRRGARAADRGQPASA